jgi:hypothetical protein
MSERPFKRIIYKCPICHKAYTSSRDPDPFDKAELVAAELAGKITLNACSTECNLKVIENICKSGMQDYVGKVVTKELKQEIEDNMTKILKDQFNHQLRLSEISNA